MPEANHLHLVNNDELIYACEVAGVIGLKASIHVGKSAEYGNDSG